MDEAQGLQPLGFSRRTRSDTNNDTTVSLLTRRLSSPIELVGMADGIARTFPCARCQVQVSICSRCDRGNRYCPACAKPARRESVRRAGRAYQSKPAGAACHARRQKRYRTHLAEICKKRDASGFTSPSACARTAITPAGATSAPQPATPAPPDARVHSPGQAIHPSALVAVCVASELREHLTRCDFCGRVCETPLRNDLRRQRGPQSREEIHGG